MKTEIKTINPEPNKAMNTEINEVAVSTAQPEPTLVQETPSQTTGDNSARLAELANNIRTAYDECEMLVGNIDREKERIADWKQRQLEVGLVVGKSLLEAKSLLPHGRFTSWCRDNFTGRSHRTLNRFMKIAEQSNSSQVSQAGGLRQAYMACTDTDQSEQSEQEQDLVKIEKLLTKAKNLLNDYADLVGCDGVMGICDLVDALNVWVTDYRARTDRHSLNRIRDAELEMSLTDNKQPLAPKEESEYATTE